MTIIQVRWQDKPLLFFIIQARCYWNNVQNAFIVSGITQNIRTYKVTVEVSSINDKYICVNKVQSLAKIGITECSINYNLNGGSFNEETVVPVFFAGHGMCKVQLLFL